MSAQKVNCVNFIAILFRADVGKLQSTGQIWPIACVCIISELKMFFYRWIFQNDFMVENTNFEPQLIKSYFSKNNSILFFSRLQSYSHIIIFWIPSVKTCGSFSLVYEYLQNILDLASWSTKPKIFFYSSPESLLILTLDVWNDLITNWML